MPERQKQLGEPPASNVAPALGTGARSALVPKSLRLVPSLSYGEAGSGNTIVQGENLATLEALAPALLGTVRCIYIDPPYNNQERYTHYDDDLKHEAWLSSIAIRLERLAEFLRRDGSLWISIDDREAHYLKVAADRILGRKNFVTTVVWQQRTTRENRRSFSHNHEYLLVYAKDASQFRSTRNLLPMSESVLSRYSNPDDDPRGPWQSVSANVQAGHGTPSQFYELIAPNGRKHVPPNGRCWVYSELRMKEAIANNEIWFGRHGNGVPRLKRFLAGSPKGLNPETLWMGADVGTTMTAKKHLLRLLPQHSVFDTPKPESLLRRILQIATNPGDIVLDAYLGSGTTAAVAHKMDRRYIGIEVGDHAVTHCAERLRKVIDGEQGGISPDVCWRGGGGYDFYKAIRRNSGRSKSQ